MKGDKKEDKEAAPNAPPIEQRDQPGYYQGFSTLAQKDTWDEATKTLVLNRVYRVPEIRFFTPHEAEIMRAILDRVLPQDDRTPEKRIPILNYIDERLLLKRFDGFNYEGMPDEDEAHRRGIKFIEAMAHERHGKSFVQLTHREQEEILLAIHDDDPSASQLNWVGLSPNHYWSLLLQDAASAYYSHPYAWDEIGFGGPAYPRGYMRAVGGQAEYWEKDESRYSWQPPTDTLSNSYDDDPEKLVESSRPGQIGTH